MNPVRAFGRAARALAGLAAAVLAFAAAVPAALASAPGARAARGRPIPVGSPGPVTRIVPGLLPRTIQLCVHCQQRPAGFWVRRTGGMVVRRPWCLSCSQELDRDHCDVIPFGG
jgi:hypothetical protein